MGQIHKPNLALSTLLITTLLKNIRREVERTNSEEEKFDLVIFGAYFVISYVLSLRGSEGLIANLTALNKELSKEKGHYLIF